MPREKTLVILKPDAVERGLVSKILIRFLEAGLEIMALKRLDATAENLDRHFPASREWVTGLGKRARERIKKEMGEDPDKFFGLTGDFETGEKIVCGCRDYYLSGPLVALVLEGEDAISLVRKLIGKTLPSKAEKGTIRGDFGVPEDQGDLHKGAARNLVHASDSPEDAERETAAWFSPF